MTTLAALVIAKPIEAARMIRSALAGRTESEAAEKLGVGLRSLRRYRRTLEASGRLGRSAGLRPGQKAA